MPWAQNRAQFEGGEGSGFETSPPPRNLFLFNTHKGGDIRLEEEFLTAKEISRLFKIHPSTPYKWIKRNAIPYFRVGEKCLRFKRSDVEFFIAEGREKELRYRKKRYFW